MNRLNVLLVLILFAVAWFLLESGQVFFAFLAGIAALFVLFGEIKESKKETRLMDGHVSAHKLKSGDRTHRFTIKDPWVNTKTVEDRFTGMGVVFFWPLKQIVSF